MISSSTWAIAVVSPDTQRSTEAESQDALLVLGTLGWVFILIFMMVSSCKLVIKLHRKYQFHRAIALLQQRVSLEYLLKRKVLSKKASENESPRQP